VTFQHSHKGVFLESIRRARVVLSFLLAFLHLPVHAGSQEERADAASLSYRITRSTADVTIDGVIGEEEWAGALAIDLALEIDPGENVPAPVRTRCLLMYDGKNLYFAFQADDSRPGEIRAHLCDRDRIEPDDYAGIAVDTFNDQRRAYEFYVNPLGVQMDCIWNETAGSGDQEDPSWDAIWKSAGRLTSDGYVVEASIPFSSMRFPDSHKEQTWGIWPFRSWPRSVHHEMSAVPMDRGNSCWLCQCPKMGGLVGVKPGHDIELDPTVTAQRTDSLEDDSEPSGGLQSGSVDTEFGLSARWGVTPNISINGALNPDFSQVEADSARLTVNTTFAVFYKEKRPFFLEGADFFTTPLQTVYTRTVADPAWGAKLSGKLGAQAVGAFVAGDDTTNLIFPSNQYSLQTTLEQPATAVVLRYRRELGSRVTVGALATGRDGADYSNSLAGIDGLIRFSDSDSVRFQLLGSNTSYPEAVAEEFGQPKGTFGGRAAHLSYSHNGRDWVWWARYRDLDSGFRADLGFIPRVDMRETYAGIERDFWGDSTKWFTHLLLGMEGTYTTDQKGTLTNQITAAYALYKGPMSSMANPRFQQKRELYSGRTYDLSLFGLNAGLRPLANVLLELESTVGDAIDYDNFRPGTMVHAAPSATVTFGRHLSAELEHVFESLNVSGGRLYTANLSQVRLVYQLNVRCFLRSIAQYLNVHRDPALYLLPTAGRERTLLTEFLFSYKLNPQTVLFLGLSDDRAGALGSSLASTDRTYFFKVGYAWIL